MTIKIREVQGMSGSEDNDQAKPNWSMTFEKLHQIRWQRCELR